MSTVTPERPAARASPPSSPSLGRAWAAVAAIPVFTFLSFAAGVATLSAFGYSSGGGEPLWVDIVVDLAATGVLLLPCVAAVFFGHRARRAGVRGAAIPMVVGAVVGVAGIVLTVVTEIGNAVR